MICQCIDIITVAVYMHIDIQYFITDAVVYYGCQVLHYSEFIVLDKGSVHLLKAANTHSTVSYNYIIVL